MKRSAYDIKGKEEYENIIVEIRARINQITGYQSYGGVSMQRLKADKIQEYLRKIDPDVLNVLAHDDDHKDLQEYVLPVVEENLKRYIEGKKITRPSETVGSETTAKQTSRLESVRESLKFNVQVLLPALAILKSGDKKALSSFLEKQSEADLDRLENMKPKGLVTKKITEEFKNAVAEHKEKQKNAEVVSEVTVHIENLCNVTKRVEDAEKAKSGQDVTNFRKEMDALDKKIDSFMGSHPEQVKKAIIMLGQKYKEMKLGTEDSSFSVLKYLNDKVKGHLGAKQYQQLMGKK